MKKKNLILIAVIAVVIVLTISLIGSYNGLVDKSESVVEKQSEISVQLQRRADLIPNFVESIKGYTNYEQETLTAVTEARAALAKTNNPQEQADASVELDGAINLWANAITEAYPELKANEQYIGLQDELAGTENRISHARTQYNEAAKKYNSEIKKFPRSLIAGLFGFEPFEYFLPSTGAEKVPQVNFE